jgi:phosphonate transport system substrate-binding protein
MFGLALFIFLNIPSQGAGAERYRIGLTPVFLDDQASFLKVWRSYLEKKLRVPVEFVQRQRYGEITELLLLNQLDIAWICGFPYIRHLNRSQLLAMPLYRGEPLYQSYLIVPATDKATRGIGDLKGAVFAYSDPDSNSGYLVPRVQLRRAKKDPNGFFGKTFFTWNHRDVVVAVADGVAQGAAVDGYVWETLTQTHPALTERTRVVWKSEPYGFPPFVARAFLPEEDLLRFRRVLLEMSSDPEGRGLLKVLNLDGFVPGNDRLFDGIRNSARAMEQG